MAHLRVPYFLTTKLGAQAVEDAIATQENEVMSVVIYLAMENLRIWNDHFGVALILLEFGLDIAKGS